MSIHSWAEQRLHELLIEAEAAGQDPQMVLRAMLSAVVRANAQVRTQEDLAHELQFLADNLDDERDYAFMRP
ncbi:MULTISPECIES: hypothetical protein [Pseudomonas aeruginosa group]|uniref:hypothetical protein n=1 Tax=Pseudomonas aeruginosa group TaxID=136841 RepID=UPI001F206E10|nr:MULTISPECIES: hypothetical protein [Pseudomonas aeruginosa group]MCP1648845.1 hypothetical protein [Pseudomonas nitroreducens]MCP1685194.1 hypothetical protein [Pseudomonas nitroreducens]